jgi:hypothetical protein
MRKLGSLFFSGALVCLTAGFNLFLVPALPGCSSCTDVGCVSGATLSIVMGADVLIPDGSTATACFNDTCVVGVLPRSPTVRLPGSGAIFEFPAGSGVSGTVWAADGKGPDRVEMSWSFPDAVPLGAGDRYRVTVADPGGVTIATKEATAVSYDTYEPNGSSCGPTCHHAQLE